MSRKLAEHLVNTNFMGISDKIKKFKKVKKVNKNSRINGKK